MILQGDGRLPLGATCGWTENDNENREQHGILKLINESYHFLQLYLFFKILVVLIEQSTARDIF